MTSEKLEDVFMLKVLAAIDRYACWILAVIVLLFIITGLGITKDFMDKQLAKQLHENVLPLPFYVFVLLHAFLPVRAKLVQWKVFKNEKSAGIYTSVLFTLLLSLFLWLHFR
jgi:cytochrome b subunit of formate dehydrogenase